MLQAETNLITQMQCSLDGVLTLGQDQEAQYELRRPSHAETLAASRPSLREINATVRSLGIHALGRQDYCVLLDGHMGSTGIADWRRGL
jgi:hypothetical protein